MQRCKKIVDIKNKDKDFSMFIDSYKTFLYNSKPRKSIFEYMYFILICLFSFNLSQQIFRINILCTPKLYNYKLYEESHNKISYDYLLLMTH